MRHTFESEQWLPYPVELVFAFFSNPQNLPPLMPAWQKARIEEASFAPPPPRPASANAATSRSSIVAGSGTCLTLSFRAFPFSPIRIPWDAEITDFVWNEQFCDVQHRGPFAYWKHCHRVCPALGQVDPTHAADPSTPGTLLHDHVEYEAPLGPIGDLANTLGLRHQLASTFAFRRRRTLDLLRLATSTR